MSSVVTLPPPPPIIRDVRSYLNNVKCMDSIELRNEAIPNAIYNGCFRIDLEGALFDDPRREPQRMYALTYNDWLSSAQCRHILKRVVEEWNGNMSLFHVSIRDERVCIRADVMDGDDDTQFIGIRVLETSQ